MDNNSNSNNNNNSNNKTVTLSNIIIIKIINYLTSLYESTDFINEINELFTIVFNSIVRDLSLVSKDWYNMVSRNLKLPNYYLIQENSLESNKSIQRMIKADSTFIKIGVATVLHYGKNLIEKYYKSISTLSLQANQSANIKINNISPFIFTNINKLELTLSECKSTSSINSYLNKLFPVEMFTSSSSDYNVGWTRKIERLIISKNQSFDENLNLTILDGFIRLGGFESLYYLKLVSNNKEISQLGDSLLIQKVSHLCLYGIKIKLDSFNILLEKNSNLKHLEVSQCTTEKDKSFGINASLSKYLSSGKCKLQSYYHDTFDLQDLNSVIVLLNSSNNSLLSTINIKTQLDLSNNTTANASYTDITTLAYKCSPAKFLSLTLPDPSFIKFIFSKVSFNLTSINLNFIDSNSNQEINENGFDYQLVETLLQILENQCHTLNTLRVKSNQKELDKIMKNPSYPSICNMKRIFKFIQERPNQIQQIDLKNIWISKSTIIESLESFNSNPKSLVRYYSISGLSDIESSELIKNVDALFINNCKLLTLGLSLLPLKSLLPKPSSFINKFSKYTPSFLKSDSTTFMDLLGEILERNQTIEHIKIDEYDEKLYYLSDSTKKRLENAIKSNTSLLSIGLPNFLSGLIPSSKSIFPYFNPIIR